MAASGPVSQGPSNLQQINPAVSPTSVGASTFTVDPATAVSQTGAQLNLSYSIQGADVGNGGVNVKFIYDTTPSINYTTSPATALTLLTGSGVHTQTIGGLMPNTTYYYRIIGNGFQFTYIGQPLQSFTTLPTVVSPSAVGASTFTVSPATNVTQTTAQLNVNYAVQGADVGYGGVDVKFVYDTVPSISYTTSPSTSFTLLNGSGTHNRTIAGLSANTTYYYRILGNGFNFTYIGQPLQTFTTPANPLNAPIMATTAASSINNTDAQLNGTYDANGSPSTIWFEYGTTPALGNTTPAQSVSATSVGSYNDTISGLSANTTYYFRAVGQNSFGTSYGSTLNFLTTNTSPSGPSSPSGGHGSGTNVPDISTFAANGIDDTSATLNGHYYANGLSTTTWFEYAPSIIDVENHDATETTHTAKGTGSDDFSKTISGLKANTTYYFRAAAENDKGAVYGTIKSFTTTGIVENTSTDLVALTSIATNVGLTSATLNGLVRNTDNQAVSAWFEYGTSPALGAKTAERAIGTGSFIPVSANASDLGADSAYFFRLVAKTGDSISRGEIVGFQTQGTNTTGVVTVPGTTVTGTDSKFIALKIENRFETIAPGEDVNYTITYKNIYTKALDQAIIEVILPREIEFISADQGEFDSARNTLVVNLGTVATGTEGTLLLDARVLRDVNDKSFLLTNAVMRYVNPDTSAQEEAIAYVVNSVSPDTRSLLGAAALFGANLLPTTLLGWLALILIVLGIAFLGRTVYLKRRVARDPQIIA